jgi:gamma-glutamyltranspeptidase
LFLGITGVSTFQLPGNSDGREKVILEGRNIIADSGMVVSAHRESSRIGVDITWKGAMLSMQQATELALAVCYPEAGNIGGKVVYGDQDR